MAERILMNEYKALSKERWVNVELHNDDILNWDIALIILNPDSLYYGGYFKAKMTFPKNYPYAPPGFRFVKSLYHPNIYKDGKLCISILHAPGEDEMSGELASERWSPAQRVESVLLSIISLLDDAECSSPANVDAGVMLRKNLEEFKKLVRKDVEASKSDIPEGFVMPERDTPVHHFEKNEDKDFWYDSDQEEDFGGSDTDAEMTQDEGDDSPDQEEEEEEEEDEDDVIADEDDEEGDDTMRL
ncbi:hypothetical protein MMC26_004497 [Xylographa opegraphella]|nr:hypothetical protein [Xylographa opegraphella]